MKIAHCIAKEIIDSRGVPTIEVKMSCGDFSVNASVPSGKSIGTNEALELRDEDGVGVSRAVANVNDVIAPEIVGKEVDARAVDKLLISLDGTDNKSKLGSNAMLGVSIAATKLAALTQNIPTWKYIALENGFTPKLPKLFMNIINGGVHADFRSPFQEYMIVPKGGSLKEEYEKAKTTIGILGDKLKTMFTEVPMGDEGGYSPNIKTIKEPFDIISSVIDKDVKIAIDVAATEFYKNGSYEILGENYSPRELASLYKEITNEFNILSIEDPFLESDTESFKYLTENIGDNILVVGDDLTTTNPSIIIKMIDKKSANAVIIKPNQIGTVSEACESVKIAQTAGWKVIASHRSGETEDTFISDFAVGSGAYGIKAGSPSQKERRVKYERLLEIETEMSIDDKKE